jgi:ABC-type transport system involved in multi-copper enzyme maturation permease subunit
MTFLPIIERELRVRARSGATYWVRFTIPLAGMLFCLPQLLWAGPMGTSASLGPGLLNGLVSAAFLLSCGACLLTADVISSERREGTLGLLLLTRVSTFDVLLGKLGSAGLTSLCALVAFLPMLMIPVLVGGVKGGEVIRKGLVLPDTLFLALAAGLWASARGREWLKTARTALLLVIALVVGTSLVGLIFGPVGAVVADIRLLSPLRTLSAAGDAMYKMSPGEYWTSLILVQAMGWALVFGAGFRLRSGWREERGEIVASAPATVDEPEPEAALPSRAPLGDDANPIAWLLQRQRGIQAILWAGALVGLFQFGTFSLMPRFLGSSSYLSVVWPLSLATTTLEGALLAWAASRFFVEARRTGELELLLTTPLGAREIVSTQWSLLKRRLRWPMLVMLTPTILQAAVTLVEMRTSPSFGPGGSFRLHYVISNLVGLVDFFFGVGALCWVGLWFGLKAGGQARAIVWTVGLVKLLPYLIVILCSILFAMLAKSGLGLRSPPFWIIMSLPQAVTLALYLGLIRLARQRLRGELAGAEPLKFDLRQSISSAARDSVSAFRKARHWTPS